MTALKAFTTLTREQKAALSKALDGFVECLASKALSNPDAAYVISEAAWNDRANWNEEQWLAWETWGWYRHFCRMVSPSNLAVSFVFSDMSIPITLVLAISSELLDDFEHCIICQSWGTR